MNLAEITKSIIDFHTERDWKINNPNDYLTSILIELAELAEHYQWKKDFSEVDKTKQQEIAYEFADVMIYLLAFAYRSGVDVEASILEKLAKLPKKYPPGISDEDYFKIKEEYRKTGKNKTYN